MGYRLRKVIKAKPQKKIKETDAIFANRHYRVYPELSKLSTSNVGNG